MAASFVIDEGRTWRPPGWVYNHVVSHLAQRTMKQDRALSDWFERCLGPGNPTFDWRRLTPSQQDLTSSEIQHLMKKVIDSGESLMSDPHFLEQLRSELKQLVKLVASVRPDLAISL